MTVSLMLIMFLLKIKTWIYRLRPAVFIPVASLHGLLACGSLIARCTGRMNGFRRCQGVDRIGIAFFQIGLDDRRVPVAFVLQGPAPVLQALYGQVDDGRFYGFLDA